MGRRRLTRQEWDHRIKNAGDFHQFIANARMEWRRGNLERWQVAILEAGGITKDIIPTYMPKYRLIDDEEFARRINAGDKHLIYKARRKFKHGNLSAARIEIMKSIGLPMNGRRRTALTDPHAVGRAVRDLLSFYNRHRHWHIRSNPNSTAHTRRLERCRQTIQSYPRILSDAQWGALHELKFFSASRQKERLNDKNP